ncbi:MAG: hypothetical protein ABIN74_02005 [Ferruginibacter sp.]
MTQLKGIVVAGIMMMMALHSTAQKALKQANKRLNNSQSAMTKSLGKYPMDANGKTALNGLLSQTDSLQKIIMNDKNLTVAQKVQALNCQCYLYDTLQSEIKGNTFNVDLLSESRDNFIPLWKTIAAEKPYDNMLASFDAKTAGVMATAFKDYPQAGRIREIATIKNLERNPENIMKFLANNINFSMRDSLIFIYGNTLPEKLVAYVSDAKNPELVKAVKENNNPLIQTLLAISTEKNYKTYLPFAGQLTEKKITLAEIDALRAEPSKYFKRIVDIELANQQNKLAGKPVLYQAPTKQYLKEYAKMFFTDVVNSLHEEPTEKARYFVFDEMRPQDLYFVITTGETELYTSSYLYTYKKLMGMFEKEKYDALFDLVYYDQYRKFLSMAGRYNTLTGFLQQMPKQSSINIVKRLTKGLEANDNVDLEELINVAETFPGIAADKSLSELTAQELKSNYTRNSIVANQNGMKAYTLLSEIFNVVKNDQAGNRTNLPAFFTAYYKIPHQTLREKDGRINEMVLFFGDEDGKTSYSSFLSNFSDASQWAIEKSSEWVKITSKKKYPISIYANLPLSAEDGSDIKAQDAMIQYLKEQQVEPRVLILRGHSYHLTNSYKYFTPSIKLGLLGSCGGYNEIKDILEKSAQAQVISTKQVGSKQVNDPMLKLINNKLLDGQDLDWVEIWADLDKQFKSNKHLYDYFKEYVPPYKNIALLVTSLYNKSGITVKPDYVSK